MGYRYPSFDAVEDDAFAQFEWDGDNDRWLFRRNGRGAPVVVTYEEKEQTERVQQRGTILLMVIFAAVYLFVDPLINTVYPVSDEALRDLRLPIALVAGICILVPGYALRDWISTRRFRDRPAVGPARSRLDIWRASAKQQSWSSLAWLLTFVAFMSWVHWPPTGLGDWTWLGMAGLFVGAILFVATLKRELS